MDGASIHEKKPSKDPHKINDLRQSAQAVNVSLHWNKPYSKRENAVVENFNGNFKRDLVLNFIMFVKEIAPAMNTEEWVTHLVALEEQINAFGVRWNTAPQSDGTSRLDKVMSTLVEGSLDITEEQIDRAVRYTMRRSFREGVVVKGKIYFNPTMIQKQCPRIWVRVRPDGPGPDVEAYSRGEHIGTLYHKDDHPNMQAGNNSACKAFVDRSCAENEKRNRRFKDMFEQLAVDGAPIVTPKQREILLRKRGLGATPETPPETPNDAPPKEPSSESTKIGKRWTGRKL